MSRDHVNGFKTDYGRRLIPSFVDELATTDPDFVYASIPRTARYADGLRDVTIKTFARAVDRAAGWIDSLIGKSDSFETISYIGPFDLRYYVILIGASKLGYQTLLPSPRNSVEGHVNLLDRTKCHTIFAPAETRVDHILAKRPTRHFEVASLDELVFAEGPVVHYPYDKTYENAAQDPFFILHTSGSTGLPKPITQYQGGAATMDAHHMLSPLDGSEAQTATPLNRVLGSLPAYHMAGILQNFLIALYYQITVIWPPPGLPVSVEVIEDALDNVTMDLCFLAPSMLEELSHSQSSLEKLKRIKWVQYAGGPLSASARDEISKYTRIRNALGSSEACYYPAFVPDPEDWNYFLFDPALKGLEFRETVDGIYEQFFVRHPSTDRYHSLWYTFPDTNEISAHDLFTKHPTKPNLWRIVGRSDDMIVFSNGEKFNPTASETVLASHPDIKGAIIVGEARLQSAALLETKASPPQTDVARNELLDSLKPYLAKVNEDAPGFAKINRDHLAFTKAEKPMPRADKGTVKRSATIKLYAKEIDQLYEDAETSTATLNSVQLDARDEAALMKEIRHFIIHIVGLQDITTDEDLFAVGTDSLQVMNLVRQLRASLAEKEGGIAGDLITPRIIYSNPTIFKLAKALHALHNQGERTYEELESDRVADMENMVAKYSQNKFTIVLTGSTGSLGSYLLDSLLASPQVSKVICLNRGTHGKDRQKTVNASRGLTIDWGDRVSFMTTVLSQPRLGLSSSDYDILVKEASFIIHNQWQVDFNLSLESFEPHIAGVRDLINLSAQSSQKPPIFFTSSIATLGNWPLKHPGKKVPERSFHDSSIPSAIGYAESKYVAERLLEIAAEKFGVSSSICRVGQLAGPVEKGGMWSKQEWLPTLIASSKYLGKIPTTIPSQDTVSWIPVDATARIIVELVLADSNEFPSSKAWTKHYNLVNPRPGSWSSLVPAITKNLGGDITPVSFDTWFDALRNTASKTDDVARNPGIKLLEWFEQMGKAGDEPELETVKTEARSKTLTGLSAVGPEWMEIWLRQWAF